MISPLLNAAIRLFCNSRIEWMRTKWDMRGNEGRWVTERPGLSLAKDVAQLALVGFISRQHAVIRAGPRWSTP